MFNIGFNIGLNIDVQYWCLILGSILGSISGSILGSTILDAPRNLCLKLIKIGSVIAEILLTLSFCGWLVD